MGKSYSDKVRSRNAPRSRPRTTSKKTEDDKEKSKLAPVIFFLVVVILVGSGIFFVAGGKDLIWGDQDGSGDVNDQNNNNDNGETSVPSYMKIPLNDVEGGIFTLERYHGKVILLDMFAMWCDPCKEQIAELRDVANAFSENDVVIISVDVDSREQAPEIREFKGDYGATWTFTSYSSEFSEEFPASSIPTMYIIGRDGSVEDTHVGVKSASSLISDLSPLVDER